MIKALKILALLLLLCPITIWALAFPMPPKDNRIVGKVQTVKLKPGDTYATIGQRFDVGYYELYEANPGVNQDNLRPGTMLIIPTKYILPSWLKNNIVINLAEMRLYYASDKLHKVFTFPIGIGRAKWNTPTGYFKIMQKIKEPAWHVPESIFQYRTEQKDKVPKIVPPGDDNPLGKYALRLSDPYYLIHGTDDPVGIGRRSSAGCIRMFPKDIKKLFSIVEVGTKVFIINKPYKVTKINNRIYLEAHMPLHEQRIKMNGNYYSVAVEIKKYAKKKFNHVEWQQVIQIAKQHIGIPQRIKFSKEITTPPKPSIAGTAHINLKNKSWKKTALNYLKNKTKINF